MILGLFDFGIDHSLTMVASQVGMAEAASAKPVGGGLTSYILSDNPDMLNEAVNQRL